MDKEAVFIGKLVVLIVSTIILILIISMAGCPIYKVYEQRKEGEAELARANSNRTVKVLEAIAAQEAAKHIAQAEIERAKGVAEANRIIGNSLKDNEGYLRYLWIHNLAEGRNDVIYVPTEAGLPILEATRHLKK